MDPDLLGQILSLVMFAGACGLLILGYPVALTLAGSGLIFASIGWLLGVFEFNFLGVLPSRYYGVMANELLVAVPLFVFMGVMLERSKIAEELLETMGRLFGRLRGGLGLSVIFVGMLLAASTGIVGATVVTMGLLSLPAMLKVGYDKKLATGIICASGTLGQIIPPSIVLVLLGDILQGAYADAQRTIGNWAPDPVSVVDLFAGAFLPGMLLVGLYMAWVLFMGLVRPRTCPPVERLEGDGHLAAQILQALVPPAILIIAVLGSILLGVATPTEAAAVGAVGAILLAGQRLSERLRPGVNLAGLSVLGLLLLANFFDLRMQRDVIPTADLIAAIVAGGLCLLLVWSLLRCVTEVYRGGILTVVMRSTMEISAMVFLILLGASVFSLVFRGLGGEKIVAEVLHDMPGGMFGAVFLVMAVMFFMGFFLDFIEIVFVVVPIVGPILLQMDMSPVWLGVMIAVNLQTSFLTPPFGFALFYLRGVAPPGVTTMDIYRGIVPFVVIQVIGLFLIAAFPALATWLPKVLFP
jgi:tripartite ATP-independent transporter DctM subunit